MPQRPIMNESVPEHPGVIAFPPALYAITLAIGLGISHWFPAVFPPRLVSLPLGALALMAAGWLSVAAFQSMTNAKTAIDPSKPTMAIVTGGVFRFRRNPLYLSLALLYIGISLLLEATWALLLLLPLLVVVQVGMIQREESYLERRFGQEYLTYKARVRRWI